MNTDKKYNGWTNYETWLFNLHFDDCFGEDAETFYKDAEACEIFTRRENATFSLAAYIEDYADEFRPEMPSNGFYADLIETGMSEINYHEIAKHYIHDVELAEA